VAPLVRMFGCLLVAAALLPAAASAAITGARTSRHGACGPGGTSTCQVWTAKVVSINDGDTIGVNIDGDGSRRIYQIRFTGIQAMEETRYSDDPHKLRGQCHAVAAALYVYHLMRLGHHRVRLTSQRPRTDSEGRLFRYLAVRYGGRWHDVGQAEMARGLTLWMNDPVDPAWNSTYNRLGQEAARRHIGMFNTTTCGSGPAQDIPLKTWVMSDPIGTDTPNGEWIKIENLDATRTIDLGHWWVRDSGLRRFTFPAGTQLAPGRTLTVNVGAGRRSGNDFYWGLGVTIFENSTTAHFTGSSDGDGDGAYVFDPNGDLRSWSIYPCLVACTDPNQGALRLTAHPRTVESMTVANVSDHPIDLYGYGIFLGGGVYPFAESSVVPAGRSMTIYIGGSPSDDTALVRHIGIDGNYLPDPGGKVALRNFEEVVLSCSAWGSASC
jgi:endonuclease YncB( thermonuclease family)